MNWKQPGCELSLPVLNQFFRVYSNIGFKRDFLEENKSLKIIIKENQSRKFFIDTVGTTDPSYLL